MKGKKYPSEEPWLSFYTAALETEQRLRLSRGAAQKKLREACASGDPRSQKQPYSMVNCQPQDEGPWERIEPSEWRVHEIDLMTDEHGCNYFVDVSEDDFGRWLNEQPAPQDHGEASPRDGAIEKRLRAGERPASTCPWKCWCDNIRKDCDESASTRGFSDETIENVTKKIARKLKSCSVISVDR
jgi:hypothetical protein